MHAQREAQSAMPLPPLVPAAHDGRTAEVRRLLDEGADVDQADEYGFTALLWASARNHIEIAAVLLEAGADVNKANFYGRTPMSWACYDGHLAMAQLLSSYGATRTFTFIFD